MIRYTLTCSNDHSFDSWFQSAEAFDRLSGLGQVNCAQCGSAKVAKTLMAPAVRPARTAAAPDLHSPGSEIEKKFAELRRQIEENSDYVGLNFAAEARAIHEGEAPARSIYGEARPDEARALIADGVAVAPLPFMPPRKTN